MEQDAIDNMKKFAELNTKPEEQVSATADKENKTTSLLDHGVSQEDINNLPAGSYEIVDGKLVPIKD